MEHYLNFWEAYDILNEIADIKDFIPKNGFEDKYSHFYSNIEDLLNSLKTGFIYSNKNIGIAQWDKNAGDKYSYVCMTTTWEGRKRAVMNFCGPYGVSFKNLQELTERNKYVFDVDEQDSKSKYVGEVSVLNKYKASKDKDGNITKITKANGNSRGYFKVLAIGKMIVSDGRTAYFISSSRDRSLNCRIVAKVFYSDDGGANDKLYQTLRDWFIQNENGSRGYMYYHFNDIKDGDLGKPTRCYKDEKGKFYILDTDKQKNKKYIPWPTYEEVNAQVKTSNTKDTKKEKKENEKKENEDIIYKEVDWDHFETINIKGQTFEKVAVSTNKDHKFAVAFKWTVPPQDIQIEELIGNGPVSVEDEEGKPLFTLQLVVPTTKGGYTGPNIYLMDEDDNYSEPESKLIAGQTSSKESPTKKGIVPGTNYIELLLGADQAKLFATLYDEHESRVYIPNKQNLRFSPADIETVILPSTINLSGRTTRILLLENFCNTFNTKNGISMTSFPTDVNELSNYIEDSKKTKKNQELLSSIELRVLKLIFELLGPNGSYKNTTVEFVKQPSTRSINANKKFYSIKVDPHARLLVNTNEVIPDFDNATKIKWHDEESVIAPLTWNGDNKTGVPSTLTNIIGEKARIGAEVIVAGKDKTGKKYILFVDNAHKASNFYELPGGGLKDKPSNNNSSLYWWTAQHRLQVKVGFTYDNYTSYPINDDDSEEEKDRAKENNNIFWTNNENVNQDTNKLTSTETSLTLDPPTNLARHVSNLIDTGKALIVNESVMLDRVAKENWKYSYYKLFTATFNEIIPEDLVYSHDNRQQIKDDDRLEAKDWKGYVCYLEWIPVEALETNRHIRRRYSCLSDIINTL